MQVIARIYVLPLMLLCCTVKWTSGGNAQRDDHSTELYSARLQTHRAFCEQLKWQYFCVVDFVIFSRGTEYVTMFMFSPGTLIHSSYPVCNQSGNCLVDKQWTDSKTLTVCVLNDYLEFGSSGFALSWSIHLAAGKAYSTGVSWDWTFLCYLRLWYCLFFLCIPLCLSETQIRLLGCLVHRKVCYLLPVW